MSGCFIWYTQSSCELSRRGVLFLIVHHFENSKVHFVMEFRRFVAVLERHVHWNETCSSLDVRLFIMRLLMDDDGLFVKGDRVSCILHCSVKIKKNY